MPKFHNLAKYLNIYELPYCLVEGDESGGEEGGGGSPSDPLAGTAYEGYDVNDLVAALKEREQELTGKNELVGKLRKIEREHQKFQEIAGSKTPSEFAQWQQSVKKQEEVEQLIQEAVSQAVSQKESELATTYKTQIEELQGRNETIANQVLQERKENALRELYLSDEVGGIPSEFYIIRDHFMDRFVYDDKTRRITEILEEKEGKMTPMFYEGQKAAPSHLLLEMRKGKVGSNAVRACFKPFNRASGAGLPATNGEYAGVDYDQLTPVDKLAAAFANRS